MSLDKLIKVTHAEEKPVSYFRINGLNSIYLSITAEETANQLALAEQIHEVMAQIQQEMPVGYEVHIPLSSFDRLPPEGAVCKVLTYHHVREDAQELFGMLQSTHKLTDMYGG